MGFRLLFMRERCGKLDGGINCKYNIERVLRMKQSKGKQRKSAIRILEESIHLLRLSPMGLLSSYYIGSMPFVLGFLYFWGDMSRSAFAREHCAVSALGLAFLFVWMKCWHAVFSFKMRGQIIDAQSDSWSFDRMIRLAATQAFIHSSYFIIMPIALVMVIPFGWCFAFYQNVSTQLLYRGGDIKTVCKKSWHFANLWSRQNHILIFVLLVFYLIVFLNLAIAIFLLPYIFKKFFGFETIFTLSGINFLNSTFLVSTIGITYLCVDPIVKTAYMLRCFYGAALTTGEDIRSELKKIMISGKTLTVILAFILCTVSFNGVLAQQEQPRNANDPAPSISLSADKLNSSIEEVINRREFTWRMPRERIKEKDEEYSGPFSAIIKWMGEMLGKGFKVVKGFIRKMINWLGKLFPDRELSKDQSSKDWVSSTRLFLMILLAILGLIVGYLFWKTLKRHHALITEPVAVASATTPDIEDDEVRADGLSTNRWLNLAGELAAKGSLRLAMRAFYLATLSNLAEKEMITIEIFKSNLDYERELQRRAYEKKEILTTFSELVPFFDRVWYGMYPLTRSDLNRFAQSQERIMALAGK